MNDPENFTNEDQLRAQVRTLRQQIYEAATQIDRSTNLLNYYSSNKDVHPEHRRVLMDNNQVAMECFHLIRSIKS